MAAAHSVGNRGSTGAGGSLPAPPGPSPGPAPEEEPRRGSPRPTPPQRLGTLQTFARQRRYWGSGSAVRPPPVSSSPGAPARHRGENPGLTPRPRHPSALTAGEACSLRAGKPFLKRPRCSGLSLSMPALTVPAPAAPPWSIAPGSWLPAPALPGTLRGLSGSPVRCHRFPACGGRRYPRQVAEPFSLSQHRLPNALQKLKASKHLISEPFAQRTCWYLRETSRFSLRSLKVFCYLRFSLQTQRPETADYV